ncbi:hypothetical protein H0H93_008756 [Arthromyces matolae]|nr:hypothetical protein H0H93_008756 [Arthromyces matolae]
MDGVDALQWLKGTEADRNLASASTIHLKDIDSYFDNVAGPLLRRRSYNPNREGFYRAFSLVSSRAFLVDAYHGLSMVPIADATTMSISRSGSLSTPDQRAFTEFSVCSQCGSLYECPHDNTDAKDEALRLSQRSSTRKPDPGTEFDSYYEMVLNAAVVPNEEIFNTYGETLSNAQLLNRYGFILDVNENDRISWTFEEVIICFAPDCWPPFSQFQFEAVVYTVAREKITERISQCNLVFYPQDEDGSSLCLDVDGRISLQLWILLALPLCLQRFDGETHNQADYLAENLVALLNYQLFMEGTDDGHHVKSSDEEAMFASLAHSTIGLCRARRAQLGKTETADPNIILDDLPEAMQLTRKAMTLMIGEQSVLDSCISAWEPYALIDE